MSLSTYENNLCIKTALSRYLDRESFSREAEIFFKSLGDQEVNSYIQEASQIMSKCPLMKCGFEGFAKIFVSLDDKSQKQLQVTCRSLNWISGSLIDNLYGIISDLNQEKIQEQVKTLKLSLDHTSSRFTIMRDHIVVKDFLSQPDKATYLEMIKKTSTFLAYLNFLPSSFKVSLNNEMMKVIQLNKFCIFQIERSWFISKSGDKPMDRKIPNLDAEEYEDANDDLYKS